MYALKNLTFLNFGAKIAFNFSIFPTKNIKSALIMKGW